MLYCCHRNPFSSQLIPVSNGSGFIVREDGIILTNAHVVGNNTTVRVKLNDGRSFDGHVQAVDPVSDLATVKINAVRVINSSVIIGIATGCSGCTCTPRAEKTILGVIYGENL